MSGKIFFSRLRRSRLAEVLLLPAAGLLLTLSHAPLGWHPLAVLSLLILFLSLHGATLRAAWRRGLLFGLGLFGSGTSWVYVAVADYSDSGRLTAVLLTLLFVAALALYPALFAWLAVRWRPRNVRGSVLWQAALLPALWLAVEWLRGWLFTGFTWLQAGYSQIDGPLLGYAPVFGVYGIGLALALTAGTLAAAVRGGLRAPARPARALALLVVGALWLGGWLLQPVAWTVPAGPPLRLALIQDNLPQETKWDEAQFVQRLDLYAAMTRTGLSAGVDAVIWPENAVTLFYHQLKEDYFDWLAAEAAGAGVSIVAGAPVQRMEDGGYYTSLLELGSGRMYHKRHLVPFGEFVPLAGALRGLIAFFDLPMSGFSPGPPRQAPLPVAGQPAAMSICYEDTFGEELLHNFPAATWLINGSNNAWYGNSLAPHQHLAMARMRAAETGRPLARATTTGISALTDARGRLLATSPQFVEFILYGSVQPMQGSTPYVRWGNRPFLAAVLLLGIAFWLRCRRAG